VLCWTERCVCVTPWNHAVMNWGWSTRISRHFNSSSTLSTSFVSSSLTVSMLYLFRNLFRFAYLQQSAHGFTRSGGRTSPLNWDFLEITVCPRQVTWSQYHTGWGGAGHRFTLTRIIRASLRPKWHLDRFTRICRADGCDQRTAVIGTSCKKVVKLNYYRA